MFLFKVSNFHFEDSERLFQYIEVIPIINSVSNYVLLLLRAFLRVLARLAVKALVMK